MKMNGNTILITGGATGIGFSMAEYFQERGNTVIICGRREDRLEQAKAKISGLHTIRCDVSDPNDRNLLFESVNKNFPSMNILINNAGIQRDIDLAEGITDPNIFSDEIRINFEAPVCLSALFTGLLTGKENAAIKRFFRPCFQAAVFCRYAGLLRDKGRPAHVFNRPAQTA